MNPNPNDSLNYADLDGTLLDADDFGLLGTYTPGGSTTTGLAGLGSLRIDDVFAFRDEIILRGR